MAFVAGTGTLKYRERAYNIQVTFDNNVSATWNSARLTEWSNSTGSQPADNHINFTSNGDTTVNGVANVDSWGINRNGKSFTTYYTAPIHSNTYCGLWRFNSGELVHYVNGRNFILTLGVDEQGNPTPYNCAYGFKVTWTGTTGNSQSVVLSY